jgi:hypothetical protein
MNTPWVESPVFKEILDSKNLTEKNKQLQQFSKKKTTKKDDEVEDDKFKDNDLT